jgi:hypothetical protein
MSCHNDPSVSFLRSILRNEGKCWTEFYRYVETRKCKGEDVAAIKGGDGRLITDCTQKANSLHSCYSLIFCSERRSKQVQFGTFIFLAAAIARVSVLFRKSERKVKLSL